MAFPMGLAGLWESHVVPWWNRRRAPKVAAPVAQARVLEAAQGLLKLGLHGGYLDLLIGAAAPRPRTEALLQNRSRASLQ